MNKKVVNIINIVLIALQLVFAILYDKLGNAYVFKTLASCWFLIIATFNFVVAQKQNNNPKWYKIFMLIGLIFAAAGDIFLIDFFIVGALLFAVGHVFYCCAFFTTTKFNWKFVVLFVAIFGACCLVLFLYKGFNFNGMLAIIIVYALIISAMLAKAISNCFSKKYLLQNIFIALGALLFFISDVCLLFYVFGGAPVWVDSMCLFTYYPAQALLASSLFFVNQTKV